MKIIIVTTLLIFSCSAFADSYDDDLNELFELTGVRNNYVSLNNVILNQMQAGFFQAASENIDGSSLSENQKQQAGEILRTRFTGMVKDYETHVRSNMSYEMVAREIYLPLYKETYSVSEVKEVITFYKSPIGKKTIKSAKNISQQAAKRSTEKYDSIIASFVEKQIEENIAIANKEITALVIQ